MQRQHSLTGIAATIGAGLLLAACGSTGNPLTADRNVAALQAAASQPGTSFTQVLANEYLTFSSGEAKQAYDWIDGDYFARKGLRAARGEAVPPEQVNNWSIPPEKRGELNDARTRLLGSLDGGGRDRAAPLAARAQARYDCWVEQQEENWQPEDIASCRGQFLQAMNELEAALRPGAAQPPAAAQPAPPAAAREYRVFFEFDRADLQPEARQVLEQVANEVRRAGTARVALVGKADRSGTDQYNLRLSARRAAAVRDELVRLGIPRDRIGEEAVGETQPPVPTADGVREPRNRVVQINIR